MQVAYKRKIEDLWRDFEKFDASVEPGYDELQDYLRSLLHDIVCKLHELENRIEELEGG